MDVIITQFTLKALHQLPCGPAYTLWLSATSPPLSLPSVLTESVAAGDLPEPADPGGGVAPHVGAAGAGLGAAGRREEPAGRPQQPARPGPGLGLRGPRAQAGEPRHP